MAYDPQGRKWHISINNPLTAGLDHTVLIRCLKLFCPVYFCLADEIGEEGTPHTHIYLLSGSPIRFSTLKGRFPTGHFEKAYGSAMHNRDYILKTGKWADSEKAETSVPGTFYEWGDLPTEQQEKSPRLYQLMESLKEGKSNMAIIEEDPSLAFHVREIDALRQNLLAERYAELQRQLQVTYLYGVSGSGKTRSIFDKYPARDIYRITNYREGRELLFDGYSSQPVLVLEEFHSQIPIGELLNLLDRYPLQLRARYADKTACFTQVYITSNLALEEQYVQIQKKQPEVWRALLRRIHRVLHFKGGGVVEEIPLVEENPLKEVQNHDK